MRLFIVSFFSFVALFVQAQGPSYFATGYLDAKEKAQQEKKQCVVIFTQDNSKSSAYMSTVCVEDAAVKKLITSNYVGVVSNVKDFDGKIIFKKWGLTKTPAIAIVSPTGTVVATVNHGLSKTKMAEFLQFYSLPGNAGKSVNYEDAAFEKEVAQWQGYKGIIEEDDAPVAAVKSMENKQAEYTAPVTQPVQPKTEPARQKSPEPAVAQQSIPQPKEEPVKQPVQRNIEKEEVVAARTPVRTASSDNKWMVQAGVFGAEASAKTLVARINAAGGKGTVETINQGDKNVYKVIAGKFPTEAEARTLINTLSGAGIQSFIKPIN